MHDRIIMTYTRTAAAAALPAGCDMRRRPGLHGMLLMTTVHAGSLPALKLGHNASGMTIGGGLGSGL